MSLKDVTTDLVIVVAHVTPVNFNFSKVIRDKFINPNLVVDEKFPFFRYLIDDFHSMSPLNIILLTFPIRQVILYST